MGSKAEGSGPGARRQAGSRRASPFPGFDGLAARRHQLATGLAQRRTALGLSQTEVGARMGTSQSAVARIESGSADLRLSTLERYAAALGTAIDWRLEEGREQ